ncbi:MAG TPA: hypothetical protein VGN33_08435 [Leifsonia sp.]|jgi:hypothetical protein|nr:hypothetical protein [Leifsonia sp.]
MADFGSNGANLACQSLQDLIGGIGSGLHDAADGVQGWIDGLVHEAAVRLLNVLLPPMVHGRNVVVKSGGWVSVEAVTLEINLTLYGASVNNTVLAGLVAKKVEEGVGHITSSLDYTHGVNSIT